MMISNCGPMLYASLGYSAIQQLCQSAGQITICPSGSLFNALVVDKIGRVPMLIAGFVGTTLCLVGECATVARFNKNGDPKVAAAAVFFLFFHLVCFSSTIDATSYVYFSEIFPTPVRAKGLGISVSGLFVTTIIFFSGAPKAFETIGWKSYIVFMVVATIMISIAYFCFPKTKGVPLEEMAAISGDEKKDEVVLGVTYDEFS
ncbi:major facilitator superfamily transporter [Fusarium pseudocircinatum]|uniref:Major facilitator superfamily transporter n=1 Tax=Fusarium pseudocircinatum TaxID=56676 RepID=A0A8H5KMY5_9HYPO|nr:major facilitator superfamily transporter [Fusarium pseudocircinatum]